MKVGDVYPTRDGRKATVIEVTNFGTAWIEVPKPTIVQEKLCVFSDSGKGHRVHETPHDLILPPKTIKAQRVIEYEGTEEWVKQQFTNHNNVCGREYNTPNGTIREVSRKFL